MAVGAVVLVLVAMVLTRIAGWPPPNSSPAPAGAGESTATPTIAPPSKPTPYESTTPPPSLSPSGSSSLVTVRLDPTHTLALTIVDQSALLLGARSATEAEQAPPDPMLAAREIFTFNPTGKSASDEVRLVWVGSICDVTAELQIGPEVSSMTVTEGPRGSCDAMGVGRGVVLSFARQVDAASIALDLSSGP